MVCNGTEARTSFFEPPHTGKAHYVANLCYSVRGAREFKVFFNSVLFTENVNIISCLFVEKANCLTEI